MSKALSGIPCAEGGGALGYRVAKTYTMTYLYLLFSAKEPCNQWLFCGKRLAI